MSNETDESILFEKKKGELEGGAMLNSPVSY